MFTLEIAGLPIAVMNSESIDEAKESLSGEASRDDLLCLDHASTGRPLWDGEADLNVRHAHLEEIAKWQSSFAKARADGRVEDEDDEWVAYLIPVHDPSDDDFDDEGNSVDSLSTRREISP